MRDREYSLFDPRQFTKPIKTQRLDSNTGILVPVADAARSIVYLAGRGDMQLRWTEIGGPSTFTDGAAPLPIAALGATLAPPTVLNVVRSSSISRLLSMQMQAEINRLYLSAKDGTVVPVSITVPRRQLIDFHPELYPSVPSTGPSLERHWPCPKQRSSPCASTC